MAIITISRQNGSLGDEIAQYLSDKLGCDIIDREYALSNFFGEQSSGSIERLNESAKFFLSSSSGSDITYKDILIKRITELAQDATPGHDIILVGLGGCVICANCPYAVNIRVCASEDTRTNRIARRFNLDYESARTSVETADRKHKRFVSVLFEKDLSNPELFDITLNTDNSSVEEASAAALALIEAKNRRAKIAIETKEVGAIDHQAEAIVFKNDTEAEFAHILDMYEIEWLYEPKTFPIEYDAEGNIKMAFSPDFYLPKFDIYLEPTTMEQKYVTIQNKKVRKVREMYPGTNVRIVYKKDFLSLVERLKRFC